MGGQNGERIGAHPQRRVGNRLWPGTPRVANGSQHGLLLHCLLKGRQLGWKQGAMAVMRTILRGSHQ
jgi:hypothetical protein